MTEIINNLTLYWITESVTKNDYLQNEAISIYNLPIVVYEENIT